MKTLFVTLFLGCLSYAGFGAVTITSATGGTNICSNLAGDGVTPGYTAIGLIRVQEGAGNPGDFSNGLITVTYTVPAGWRFNTGAIPSFSFAGLPGNDIISVNLVSLTASTLTFNVITTGTTNIDRFDVSGLQVQAITSGAISGSITGNTSAGTINGMASSNMGNLSLNPATTPAVTIAASPSNVVCAGTMVTFTPSPSNAVTPTYNWFLNGNPQGISPTFSYVPTNGDVVWAQMTSNGSCETNSTPFSNTINMTVNALPTVSASASPNPLCQTATLSLSATPLTGAAPYSYSWTGPGGYVAGGQTPSRNPVTLAGAGVYNVSITDNNGCTSSSPGATAAVVVNQNPTISASATPNPICVGQTLNLNSVPSGGSGVYTTFSWSSPGGFTAATQNTANSNITTGGAGVYSVTVTDNNGCTSTAPGTTASVVVNNLPAISATAVPTNICVGNTLTLNSAPSGGSGVYSSFAWNGPGGFSAASQNTTNPNITLAGAGTYSVTVTDGNGCTSNPGTTASVAVNSNPTISASALANPICAGQTLNLTSSPAGGALPYAGFAWNGPGFTAGAQNTTRTNIPTSGAGVYTVTVTDNNGCIGMGNTASVVVNALPTITASATPNPICVGQTLTLTSAPVGGSGVYTTFSWSSPGGFTAATQNTANSNITTGGAGVYSVTVTDNNGCTSAAPATTASVVVNNLPTIFALAAPTNICVGNTLTLTSTPAGGSGVYNTFSWSSPGGFTAAAQNTTNPNITLAGAGVYSVTVTDGNGCTSVPGTTASVVVNTNPTISAGASPNPACVGNTLLLTSTPAGGSGVYSSFAWNGPNSFGAGTQNTSRPSLTVADAGVYSVTVTDNNGCIGRATTANVPVNTNPTVAAFATPTSICVGSTLNLQSVPAGGSGVYSTFSWSSPGGFVSAAQNTTNPNITLAGAGVYSVVVTDNNGCISAPGTTTNVVVHANPSITATATPNPICVGNTLTLNSTPSGGSGTYSTFAWNGPSFTAGTQNTTNPNITLAGLGVYSVTVTDNFGCVGTGTTPAVVVYTNPSIVAATATPNPICEGNTLNLGSTPSGGSGVYVSYAWNGPAGYTAATQAATRPAITTAHAGVYSVTVTDDNGCFSAPGTTPAVVVNTNPSITAGATPNPICVGNTLSITSSPAGGSGSYTTYSWTGPNGFTSAVQNPFISTITTAAAGVYSVNVTDGNGCTSVAPGTTPSVVVNTLPTITVFATPNPLCVGSTLNLTSTPAGGSGTYSTFAWNGPNAFTSASQNPSVTSITTAGAGVYSVTVSDNNGCTSLPGTSTFVTVNTNPTIGTATATPNPICEGSTLNLNATGAGGSGTYVSFAWNGPAGYTAATQAATNPAITTAGAGAYSVTVTDNNGCTSAIGTTPAVVVNTNPTITANASPNPLCNGTTLALNSTPAGGDGSYISYSWTGPNGFTATTQNPSIATVSPASAGVYSVNVTDGNGCTSAAPGTTPAVVIWSLPTVAVGAIPNPLCESATLALSATPGGGSGVYTNYSWNGPNGFMSAMQSPSVTPVTLAGAGTYTVTVTDSHGCVSLPGTSPLVIVNSNPTVVANAASNPICEGTTLNLTSTPSGGTLPYTVFSWAGPGFTAATQNTTNPNITLAGAGVYSMTVTDVNGCMGTGATATVIVNTNPTITAAAAPNPICENNTLNLSSTPAGGSGTYSTFAWDGPGAYTAGTQAATRTNILAATGAGVYSVTVTDNNGCIGMGTTAAVVVNFNPSITANAAPDPICEGNTLTLTGGASGGSGTYVTYSWTGPNSYSSSVGTTTTTVPSITTAGAGVYSVTVTDNNGCSGSAVTSSVVVNTNPVVATATATPNPICSGAILDLASTATGGSGVYTTYDWAGLGYTGAGQNTTYINIPTSGAGVYSVTVTDNNGCISAPGTTASVVVNPSPTIVINATPNPICEGNNTLTLNSTPSGGSGTYVSFAWSGPSAFSATTQNTSLSSVTPANSGVYNVTVTDNNGCFGSGFSNVTVNPLPVVFNVTGGGSYCQNTPGVHIGLDGSEVDVDYTLYYTGTLAGTQSGTGAAIDFGLFTAAGGPYTVTATNSLTGCTRAMSGNTSVTILPLPAHYDVTGGGAYCLNGPGVPVGLSSSAVGFSYQLYDGAAAIGAPVAGTGAAITFGMQTTVTTYTVLATNDFTGCQDVMNGSATVTTLPLPADHAVAGGGLGCEGTGFHIGIAGSDFGIDYQVYNGGTPVGAAVPGNGGGIDFGIFSATGTYTVLATNTSTGCQAVMSGLADIVINPLPTVFAITGGGGYCVGGPGAVIGLAGSEASNIEYQLYNGSTPVGLPVAGTGAAISFGPQLAAGTYSVSATNTLTLCTNNMSGSTVVVPNNLPAVYTVSGSANYCSGGIGVPVMLSGSEAGVDYVVTDGTTTVLTGTGTGAAPFTIGNVTAAGTFSVVATNPATTCTSDMTGDVTVGVDPLPLDQTITGGGTICAGGTPLSIDLPASEAGIEYQLFLGGVAQSAPMAGGGAVNFGTFSTAGTYTVQATNTVTGCNTVLSGNAVIIVNPLPAAITGPSSVCEGASIALSNVDGPGVWNTDNAAVATVNPTTGNATGVSAGTANITYTLNTGCSISTMITVNQTPTAITGSSSVCIGSAVTLASTPAAGTWSNTNPAVATVDVNTGVVTGVSAGTDMITYTLTTGCYTTRIQTVNPLPTLPSISASATSVCVGSSVTYFNGQAGGTWSSSNPSVATVDVFNGIVTGQTAGTANIIYGYTNGSGCSNTTSLAVTVNSAPGVSIITGPNNVCSGAVISLANATAGGVWSSSDVSFATVSSTGDVSGVAPGIITIYYTVTNGFGCTATAAHALQVGNMLPATAVLPVGGASLCGGNPVNLSVVSSGTLTSYQWVLNGLDILGANGTTYTTMTPGFYQITIGDGSCTQTLTAGTTVVPAPDAVIAYDSVNNILYTGSFTTYEWFLDGAPIAGANSSLITPMGDGLYAVVVSDGNGCSDTATFQMGIPTGVTNTGTMMNVRIYPNPVTSTLFIDAPGKVFVTVLSADGKMLINHKEAVSINVGQLADGMYMIMLHDENGALVKTDKFMKMQ